MTTTRDPRGLCPGCAHVRVVRSDRGSVFLRCALAATGSGFAKYPPQPVLACSGYEKYAGGDAAPPSRPRG